VCVKQRRLGRSVARWACSGAVVLGCLVGAAPGDVFPIGPEAFGPATVVEDFENIVNVTLPADPFWVIFADVPVPWDFGSGVWLTAANPEPDGGASIADWQFDPPGSPDFGWGLSLDGGDIGQDTQIPSPTSILCHDTYTDMGEIPPLELTFDSPVARVGFYTEAAIFHDIGWEGLVTLEAFDELGASLGLVEVYADGVAEDNAVDTWIGLEVVGAEPLIKSVEIVGRYHVMDDLHFEVPEPGALSLLVIGALALLRRR
jgi:hypothetical protein